MQPPRATAGVRPPQVVWPAGTFVLGAPCFEESDYTKTGIRTRERHSSPPSPHASTHACTPPPTPPSRAAIARGTTIGRHLTFRARQHISEESQDLEVDGDDLNDPSCFDGLRDGLKEVELLRGGHVAVTWRSRGAQGAMLR